MLTRRIRQFYSDTCLFLVNLSVEHEGVEDEGECQIVDGIDPAAADIYLDHEAADSVPCS